MDSSKFLILGANGQLGKALQLKYPNAKALGSSEFDITSPEALMSFDWSSVTHLLNAAGYTNVDGAESEEGRKASWQVNATAIANLAEIADEHDLTIVHISSDYVFDGTQHLHTEKEPITPLSVYGASKAAGDLSVANAHKHYILRTSWVIGDGKNFVQTMAGLAGRDISPTVVHDQVGRLTFTSELVKAIDHLLTSGANYGTYNVTNSGDSASWADITRKIFEIIGRSDLTVTDTTTEEYFAGKEGIAPRPLRSTLDLTKVQATGFESTDWITDLETYLKGDNS